MTSVELSWDTLRSFKSAGYSATRRSRYWVFDLMRFEYNPSLLPMRIFDATHLRETARIIAVLFAACMTNVPLVSGYQSQVQPSLQKLPGAASTRPKVPPEEVVRLLVDLHMAVQASLAAGLHDLDEANRAIPLAEKEVQLRLQYEGSEWWETIDAQRSLEDLKRLIGLTSDQRADLIRAYSIHAKHLVDDGKFEEAIDATKEKCNVLSQILGTNHPDHADCLEELGGLYQSSGRFENARDEYLAAVDLLKQSVGEFNPLYFKGVDKLGSMFLKQGQYPEAQPIFEHLLANEESIARQILAIGSLPQLLSLYTTTKQYSKAINMLQQVLEVFGQKDTAYVSTLRKLSELYKLAGESDQAKRLLQQIEGTSPQVSSTRERPSAPKPEDWTPRSTPQLPEAIAAQVAKKEKQIKSALSNPKDQNEIDQGMVNAQFILEVRIHYQGQNWWETVNARWMLEGLKRVQKLNPDQRIDLDVSLHKFDELESEIDTSFQELLGLCDIRGKLLGEDYPDYPKCLNEAINLQTDDKDKPRAEQESRRASELLKTSLGDMHPDYAESLGILAALLDSGGGKDNDAEVKRLYNGKIAILKNTSGNSDTYISALQEVADYYKLQGELSTAEAMLLEAIKLYTLQGTHPQYFRSSGPIDTLGELYEELAKVYIRQKSYATAEDYYQLALDTWKITKEDDQPFYACAENDFAELLTIDHREPEAATMLLNSIRNSWRRWTAQFPGLSLDEKHKLIQFDAPCGYSRRSHVPPIEKLLTLVFSNKNVDPAIGLEAAFLTKQLVYDAARQENFAMLAAMAFDPTKWRAEWEQMRQLRREYQSATQNSFSNPNPLRVLLRNPAEEQRVESLAHQIHELEKHLRRDDPEYSQEARLQQLTLEDVQKALPLEQVLIEYVYFHVYDFKKGASGKAHYGALILRGGANGASAIDLGDATEIDALVDKIRGRNSNMDKFISASGSKPSVDQVEFSERAVAKDSEQLRSRIWQPIESKLTGKERVYIAAEGQLGLVPFEILPSEDERGRIHYLIEEREMVYLSTGRDLARFAFSSTTNRFEEKKAVLIGNPAFNAPMKVIAETVMGLAKDTETSMSISPLSPAASQNLGDPIGDLKLPRNWSENIGPALDDLVSQVDQQLRSLGWSVQLLTRENAVEEAVERLDSPAILQIATHGLFLAPGFGLQKDWQNPFLRSMLVLAGANSWKRESSVFFHVGGSVLSEAETRRYNLTPEQEAKSRFEVSNGFLTAYEVSGMNLRHTQLVNLTACDTALGDITVDGVAGLRQGFLSAGARSVIMSMWAVPARETVQQMKGFYENWLINTSQLVTIPTNRYQAFRTAQLAALESARNSHHGSGHPFYWAGFVYFGDPGDLPHVSEQLQLPN